MKQFRCNYLQSKPPFSRRPQVKPRRFWLDLMNFSYIMFRLFKLRRCGNDGNFWHSSRTNCAPWFWLNNVIARVTAGRVLIDDFSRRKNHILNCTFLPMIMWTRGQTAILAITRTRITRLLFSQPSI